MEPVFEFPIDLAEAGPQGLTRSLHEQIRAAILDGRLKPGAELPSTRRAASAYGLARNTVIAAYELLMAEGYVVTRAGARAVVAAIGATESRRARRTLQQQDRLASQVQLPQWATHVPAPDVTATGFQLGVPEHRGFPFDVWRRLLARSLNPRLPASFKYQDPSGHPLLRSAIAQHVSYTRAVACSADDVVITSGAQQAFYLLARTLVASRRMKAAVEEPGYPPMRAAMAAAGVQLTPVSVDHEGLCVDQLPADARIICATPSHQFPTGVAMSMQRRSALLEFARNRDAVIIEDDYDGEFRYGERPLDALQTLDRDARVFYVGTFSKSIFPALRVGYIVAPPWAHAALVSVKQCIDGAGNAQVQEALARFILDGHLARHVRRIRKVYASRRESLLHGIARELDGRLEAIPSEAGIHIATRYRDANARSLILPVLRQHAPGAQPMSDFAMRDGEDVGVAFGFGRIEADEIGGKLRSLSMAIRRRERTLAPFSRGWRRS